MSKNIRGIFWGAILVLIDVRLGSLDILPDIIGAIIIAFSLYGLKDINQRINIAWKCAVVYALLIGAGIIFYRLGYEYSVFMEVLTAVANLVMMFNLLNGLGMAAKTNIIDCRDLGEALCRASNIYCFVYISVFLLSHIPIISIWALIGGFIYYIRLLVFIFKLGKCTMQ